MKNKALEDIYRLYLPDIFRYLYFLCHDYYLAEDLVSETFYRAFLFLEDCPGGKVKPWLFKVAYHAFIDFQRKNHRVLLKDNSYFEQLREGEAPDLVLIRKETMKQIADIINNLPGNQKQAILLHDLAGIPYKEAAEIMNVSLNYFKVLLFRARQKIRTVDGRLGENE
ncbi:MAG: sigma-70 family RNA polymerase sigma factor [Syntrophomonadaceae bacterium]